MNGYSKMRVSSSSSSRKSSYTTKARSIDFSDPTTHAYASPAHPQENLNPTPKDDKNVVVVVGGGGGGGDGGGGGERFGAALRRNFSSGSQRFRASDCRSSSSSTFGAVVRRAFSMRKAASVAEGYWRIDGSGEDGDGELMDQEEEGGGGEGEQQVQMRPQSRNKKKNNNKGSIFRACKRLFGL